LRLIAEELQSSKYNAETDRAIEAILHKRLIGDYGEALLLTRALLQELGES